MRNRLLFFGVFAVSLVGICAAALIIVCPGGSNGDSADRLPKPIVFPPARSVTYYARGVFKREDIRLTSTLVEGGGTAPVYRALPPSFDDAHARSIAKKLGLEGEPKRSDMPEYCTGESVTLPQCSIYIRYTLDTANAQLEIYPKAFTYSRRNSSVSGTPYEMSDETAADTARSFLSEHSLLPDYAEVVEVRQPEGKGGKTVTFQDKRLNQNLADTWINVALSADGQFEEIDYLWLDILFLGDYPIVSEMDAFNRIFDGPSDPGILILSDQADLTAPELYYEMAYDTQPGSEVASGPVYYLPYYRFCQPENPFACMRVPALPLEYIFPPGYEWPPQSQATESP